MTNELKTIALAISIGIFSFFFTSCSNEAKDQQANVKTEAGTTAETNNAQMNKSSEMAENSGGQETPEVKPVVEEPSNVYNVESVSSPVSGKYVDFTWIENGEKMRFSDYAKNKTVLVNFWGTWCPPCRREIPDLIKVSDNLKDKDFVIIGIALERDRNNALQRVRQFASAQGINYKVFVDDKDQLVTNYAMTFGNIEAVPTTFIFNKKAKFADKIVGMRDYDGFMSSINKVMN